MIDSDSTEYAGTPLGTCFAARSSEEFMVKAGGEKGSEAYCPYAENLFRRQRRSMGSAANRSRKRFWDEFLVHDHLHSPAVVLTLGGTIHERYEYDAYGNPTIYTGDGNWFDGDETSGESSALGNPYLFTGRRVDFLDSNDLVLQYNRNRYYDYYTGRWLTQDPLGITPNPQKANWFATVTQYTDGLSLYEYARSRPAAVADAWGLQVSIHIANWKTGNVSKCGTCGPDISQSLMRVYMEVDAKWRRSSLFQKWKLCSGRWFPKRGWDIHRFYKPSRGATDEPTVKKGCCPSGKACTHTVTACGSWYAKDVVNYWLWGRFSS